MLEPGDAVTWRCKLQLERMPQIGDGLQMNSGYSMLVTGCVMHLFTNYIMRCLFYFNCCVPGSSNTSLEP